MLSTFFDRWLNVLPDFWIFVVVAGIPVVAVVLAPQLRRLLIGDVSKEFSDGAAEAFKAIITFMVFILAFSLLLVQTQYRAAEEIITKESNTLNVMDRMLWRLGGEQAAACRLLLRDYAKSVVRDEWPTLAHGKRNDETTRLLGQLSQCVLSVESTTNREQSVYHQILVHLDELSDLREHRIAEAEQGLGDLYWGTVTGLVLILVMLAAMVQATIDRAFALSGLICAASLLLALVVILNKPFTGENVVSPDPIERVIRAMAART